MNEDLQAIDFELASRHQIIKMSKTDISPKTGFEEVDRYIKALLPTSLTVIGAESSVGKTTLTANIAVNVAIQGKKVLFFSLESGYSITQIIASYLSQKPYEQLDDKEKRLDIPNLKIVAPNEQIAISDVEKISLDESPDLIIVDHIHYLLHSNDNLAGSIAQTVRSLQLLARRLNTHIIVVAHLKKPESGRENEIPNMYRLKDSSALYQDPSNVILLSRKRKNPELMAEGEDIFESEGLLVVAKNRDYGSTGICRFFLDRNIHSFLFTKKADIVGYEKYSDLADKENL